MKITDVEVVRQDDLVNHIGELTRHTNGFRIRRFLEYLVGWPGHLANYAKKPYPTRDKLKQDLDNFKWLKREAERLQIQELEPAFEIPLKVPLPFHFL